MADEEDNLRLAKAIMRQLGIAGEIGPVMRQPEQDRVAFPVSVPGRQKVVTVDTSTGQATIETRMVGLLNGLIMLHRIPGPHLVGHSGNWFWIRLWHWMADVTVYATLFLTATGIYLWAVLRAERKTGLIVLGAGVVSIALLTIGLWF